MNIRRRGRVIGVITAMAVGVVLGVSTSASASSIQIQGSTVGCFGTVGTCAVFLDQPSSAPIRIDLSEHGRPRTTRWEYQRDDTGKCRERTRPVMRASS